MHQMRPGQNNKRMRGRNNRKGPNPLSRSYESNGGDVKIRGTAIHIAEKYVQLSRDASSSGDRVAAENYLQHAEHYYRIVAAAQAQMPQPQPVFRSDDEYSDGEEGDERETMEGGNGLAGERQGGQNQGGQPPQYGGGQPNPYAGQGGQQPPQYGGPRPEYSGQQPPQYNPNDQQPYMNGSAQEQPYEGGGMDNRDNRDNRDRGGFRRRRRPFRDRHGGGDRGPGQGGEQNFGGGGGGEPQAPANVGGGPPQGEDGG